LFLVATALFVVAGIQLYVLTTRTDHFFAWTIAPPLTAAVDGAFYLGAFFLLYSASRQREWASARPAGVGVLVVSTFKLLATLLHTGRFHFHDPDAVAQFAAWGWLAVYVVVPPVLLFLLIRQARAPGTDPPGGDFDWGAVCAWIYVGFFASVLAVGLYGWWAGGGAGVATGFLGGPHGQPPVRALLQPRTSR
jgi:hypothetical protein